MCCVSSSPTRATQSASNACGNASTCVGAKSSGVKLAPVGKRCGVSIRNNSAMFSGCDFASVRNARSVFDIAPTMTYQAGCAKTNFVFLDAHVVRPSIRSSKHTFVQAYVRPGIRSSYRTPPAYGGRGQQLQPSGAGMRRARNLETKLSRRVISGLVLYVKPMQREGPTIRLSVPQDENHHGLSRMVFLYLSL